MAADASLDLQRADMYTSSQYTNTTEIYGHTQTLQTHAIRNHDSAVATVDVFGG